MGLLVGEQSEDDEGEEMQQKLKPYLCEALKSTAYLKKLLKQFKTSKTTVAKANTCLCAIDGLLTSTSLNWAVGF